MIRDLGELWPEEGDRLIDTEGTEWVVVHIGPKDGRFTSMATLKRDDGAERTMAIGALNRRLHREGWEFDAERNVERSRIDVEHERALEKRDEVSE